MSAPSHHHRRNTTLPGAVPCSNVSGDDVHVGHALPARVELEIGDDVPHRVTYSNATGVAIATIVVIVRRFSCLRSDTWSIARVECPWATSTTMQLAPAWGRKSW